MNDHDAMQLALTCAHSVEGRTSPRPSVGAVIIRDGQVVGQGATSPPYGPHAEVHAIQAAGDLARGATLYVTLEPCSVTIHTPPCTEAIIAAGIARVVVATLDPNPRVYRNGIAQLRAAGIEVTVGVAEEEAHDILLPFATYIIKSRPYTTAKWAMTLDGKIATHTGDSRWISNEHSRLWVHNLRDRVDAILIGSGTARTDNPQLTVRLTDAQRTHQRAPRSGPLRIILSTNGQLSDHLSLLHDQPELTRIIVGETCSQAQFSYLQATGAQVIQVANNASGSADIQAVLTVLYQLGLMHILIEGGSQLLSTFFDQQLIDHVAIFIAPKLIGGARAPSPLQGTGIGLMQHALQLSNLRQYNLAGDILIEGDPIKTHME